MPPLKALRAFEAAARSSSFQAAADELGVTPGAIAQQVRKLEEWLGHPLFHRHPQGVTLTSQAAEVLPELSAAFERLGLAVQNMRAKSAPASIRIAALPCIAQLWLLPRLSAIKQSFPNIQISVAALEGPPDFAREMYDLAIFYTRETGGECDLIQLADDMLFPVASPALQLSEPEDLTNQVLLHDSTWQDDWAKWLKAAGLNGGAARRGPSYSLYSLALQSAIEGGGVLMGRQTLVEGAIEAGRLVKPFELELPAADPLTLMVPKNRELPEQQSALIDWLLRN